MNKNLEEISDGKRYGLNDMVRAACNDCAGCSSCCEDMGESILLDPLDIYMLTKNLNCTFENLLQQNIELHVADGLILPNLKMTQENVCPFLKEKRCSIHSFRPGICRVFPLGRIYEENKLDYFLQLEGCVKENRSKVKVSKWLDTPQLKQNQQYLIDWHAFRIKEQPQYHQQQCIFQRIHPDIIKKCYNNKYSDRSGIKADLSCFIF